MKTMKIAAIATIVALLAAGSAFAADKAKKDKDLLIGTWTVAEGIYADGSVEKEMEMAFTISATAMSNPMDESTMPYALDDKTKTIIAKTDKSSMKLVYKVTDNDSVDFVEMTVTSNDAKTGAAKSSQIVGPKGTFKSLKLKRAK